MKETHIRKSGPPAGSAAGRLKPLVAAIVLASAGAPGMALGQGATIDEVVVTGRPILDAQEAALDAKRQADNYMDVVSADTIGRFPDQNIAASLSRLPGVAVERDQGQARFLNVRGAPFRYTAIAFDGIDVPGAQNGRIPRFDAFPATITERIDVNKAILPSMPGESVSGFVNIETFKPFDIEGPSLSLDIGRGEQDLGGGDVERNSFRASYSNEQFGAVGFYSKNRRVQQTDNRELERELNAGGDLVVNELDYRAYNQVDREDEAWGGRVEYRGEGAVQSLFASTLDSEFVDDENMTQYLFEPQEPRAGAQVDDVLLDITRNIRFANYENSTFTNTLGADIRTARWNVQARLNYTETEIFTDFPFVQSVGSSVRGSYELRGSDDTDPPLQLETPVSQVALPVNIGIAFQGGLDTENTKLKLDASREISVFGRDSTMAVGAQYDQREAEGAGFALFVGGFPDDIDLATFDTGVPRPENHTTNTIGATLFDAEGVREAWAASGQLPSVIEPPPDELIAIDEDIYAVYAMATTRFDWGNVVYGLRTEYTDYTSAGLAGDEPLTVDDDFLNLLPSVHLNVDLADDFKFRASISSGVNRPTYDEWRAGVAVNPAEQEVSGGNPFLDPEKTMGGDLSLEWYYATASILSLGAFHREIDNVIYQDVTTVDGGQFLPSAAGESWTLSGATNGTDGKLTGLEANLMFSAMDYFDGPMGGMGFSANATVLDSEFEALDGRELGLPGTSELIFNASVFYEQYGFSARINYQYRDEWISPTENPDEVWGEMERVDATISYDLPFDFAVERASVYANFNNITDEVDVRFAGNGTLNQSESFGRHFMIGLRVDY